MTYLTVLFTKPPVGILPVVGTTSFQLLAPFTAYGSFRNCTRQNHGMAGNPEAGGFVNRAVSRPLKTIHGIQYVINCHNMIKFSAIFKSNFIEQTK